MANYGGWNDDRRYSRGEALSFGGREQGGYGRESYGYPASREAGGRGSPGSWGEDYGDPRRASGPDRDYGAGAYQMSDRPYGQAGGGRGREDYGSDYTWGRSSSGRFEEGRSFGADVSRLDRDRDRSGSDWRDRDRGFEEGGWRAEAGGDVGYGANSREVDYGRSRGATSDFGRRYPREDAGRVSGADYSRAFRGAEAEPGYGDYGAARAAASGYGYEGAPAYGSAGYGAGQTSQERFGRHEGFGEHRGRGPKGYVRSDERIHEEVNDRLTDDPRVDATHIHVEVKQGEVTLSGHVNTRRDKRRAEDVIEHLSGVKHVQNNLRVHDTNYDAAAATAGGPTSAGPLQTGSASGRASTSTASTPSTGTAAPASSSGAGPTGAH